MRVGIDFGGTKIAGLMINDKGETLAEARTPTPGKDYGASLIAVQNVVNMLEGSAGVAATSIGVGIPGAADRETGRISKGYQTGLHGHTFGADLNRLLKRPVSIANDANCFALSEATDGAGKGFEVVFGVILGTGVGGGIVVNGTVLRGANAIAGEWGHNILPNPTDTEYPGPQCNCGGYGHLESWLSGPALAADYARSIGIGPAGGPSPAEIVTLALTEKPAEDTLRRYEERLARALANVVNILDPDVIVLGGGVSNMARLYTSLPRLVLPYIYADSFKTRIMKNIHGDSSGVRGAAWL